MDGVSNEIKKLNKQIRHGVYITDVTKKGRGEKMYIYFD